MWMEIENDADYLSMLALIFEEQLVRPTQFAPPFPDPFWCDED